VPTSSVALDWLPLLALPAHLGETTAAPLAPGPRAPAAETAEATRYSALVGARLEAAQLSAEEVVLLVLAALEAAPAQVAAAAAWAASLVKPVSL